MLRKIVISILFIYAFSYLLSGQKTALQDVEEIAIKRHEELGLVYPHQLHAGETMYRIAKYFNISLDDLLRLNKIEDVTDLDIGQVILIPFDTKILLKSAALTTDINAVPVTYQVAAKENLYRISKHYFDQPVETMKERNALTSNHLDLGQKLIVGWVMPYLSPQQNVDDHSDPRSEEITISDLPADTIGVYIKNKLSTDTIDVVHHSKVLRNSKEIATWDRNAPKTTNKFALHRTAAINSIIEIHNPLINRTTFATVIGRVPKDSYTDDITLIISPSVVDALGILDKRFMVEVKYYENVVNQ